MLAIALRFTLASLAMVGISLACVADESNSVPIDSKSGLKVDENEIWKLVNAHCGSCHSGRLLAQHSLDRSGWLETIRRMQSDENLWDLGDSEAQILDYLSENYGRNESRSDKRVRRAPLDQQPIEHDEDVEKDEVSTDRSDSNPQAEETTPTTSDEL
ncbi:MAG: hypothetical protein OXG24_00145 [Gammaproteobacteria bacterium]|nr:hypothetical protein [Gammaproteobacteria bacterium]